MTMDAYSICPGGTGKKIKHCQCRDIVGDLEKIVRSIEGNQRVAALDRINRIMATKAHRPCLLALKTVTLLGMNEMQGLEDTVTTFVKVAPDNPLAQGFAAMLEVRKNRISEAVDHMQSALWLAASGDVFPGELFDILATVAHGLYENGQYLAARAHLVFRLMLGGPKKDAARPLSEVNAADDVPTLLKRDLLFEECPKGATWKARFNAALRNCVHGAWRKGLEEFEKLNREFPENGAILKNIATARSYLGYPEAAQSWHDYARCDGIPFESAVEAEATAQLLEQDANLKLTPFVKLTRNVTDAKALSEQLLSSKLVISHPQDAALPREDDSPPPKLVFTLIDRPMPDSTDELSEDTVPRLLCKGLLFGRETDREPRLELYLPKNDACEQSQTRLAEIGGDLITQEVAEEIINMVPTQRLELFPSFEFPAAVPVVERHELTGQVTKRLAEERWPELPLAELDDKSPEQVKDDPAYRVRLAAALVVLEEAAETDGWPVEVDALRSRLGVPVPPEIDPSETDIRKLVPSQWARVAADKLSDEELLLMFQRSSAFRAKTAAMRFGAELLQRDTIHEDVNREALCGFLAGLSSDSSQAIEYLGQARRLATANNNSPAQWMLRELPVRILRGESREAQQLVEQLQRHHIREPGVAESLYNVLVQMGVIRPEDLEGTPGASPEGDAAAEPAAQGQSLWTPGGSEAAQEPKRESKLWVPD